LASDFVIALVPASYRKFVGGNSLPPLPSSVELHGIKQAMLDYHSQIIFVYIFVSLR